MAHYNTVFSQLLKLIPRHEFETLAKQHHSGRSFRSASRWSQFVTMAMGQLSGRNSLRDIVENISAQDLSGIEAIGIDQIAWQRLVHRSDAWSTTLDGHLSVCCGSVRNARSRLC